MNITAISYMFDFHCFGEMVDAFEKLGFSVTTLKFKSAGKNGRDYFCEVKILRKTFWKPYYPPVPI